MIGLPQLKARIARIDKLVDGPTAEVAAWKKELSPLKQGEQIWYLGQIECARDALANARKALAQAARREEDHRRYGGAAGPPTPHQAPK